MGVIDFEEFRGLSGVKEAWVEIKGRRIKVAIAHGTGNARKVLDRMKAGEPGPLPGYEANRPQGAAPAFPE